MEKGKRKNKRKKEKSQEWASLGQLLGTVRTLGDVGRPCSDKRGIKRCVRFGTIERWEKDDWGRRGWGWQGRARAVAARWGRG